jgi:hypothetical protein
MTFVPDSRDPAAMMKAWMPFGGFAQFQRAQWESGEKADKKD